SADDSKGDGETVASGEGGGNCFASGTRVLVGDGAWRRIEDFRVGDSILAYNPTTGEASRQTVTSAHRHERKRLLRMNVEGLEREIFVTASHPFWVDETWRAAGEIAPGARVGVYE